MFHLKTCVKIVCIKTKQKYKNLVSFNVKLGEKIKIIF